MSIEASARQHPVEDVRRALLERRVAPRAALGVGHVGPRLPGLDQLQAHLGRVLEVGVHDHHRVAPGRGVEAGGHRDLVAEVAGQRDHRDPLVGLAELEQQVERLVAAAVVDVDELEVEVGPLVGRGHERLVEREDAGGLVVDRQHVGDQSSSGGHAASPRSGGGGRPDDTAPSLCPECASGIPRRWICCATARAITESPPGARFADSLAAREPPPACAVVRRAARDLRAHPVRRRRADRAGRARPDPGRRRSGRTCRCPPWSTRTPTST